MTEGFNEKIRNFIIKHKRGIKITVFIVLVGGMIFRGVMQIPQINTANKEIAKLHTQIEYEKERQKEVQDLRTKVNTDEYIEKIASEKLGLIKNNAKIFVDVSGEMQNKEE